MLSLWIAGITICVGCAPPTPICNFDLNLSNSGNYEISTAPAMPTITGTVTNKVPANATITWTATIRHTAPGGACSGGPTFQKTVTGSGSSYSPSFGGFYGGELTVIARCAATGYDTRNRTANGMVKGTQPTDAAIVAEIGSVSSPFNSADLRRIDCHESSLRQFVATGTPLYGGGGDAGIMQACFQRTNSFLWNWRSNVSRGRSILNTSRNSAQNHLENEVNNEGATAYTTAFWREESIHRYNAGTGSGNEYREWNASSSTWVIVDRGGVGGYVPAVTGQSATCS